MPNENKISRRTILKVLAAGSALPLLERSAFGQHTHQVATTPVVQPPHFFNPHELTMVSTISDLIIPTDDHSPGAIAAGVPAFIDLMVGESPTETKVLWREGLAAIDRISVQIHSAAFVETTQENQTSILKTISRNERRPKTIEENFFVAIKGLTVDGYYTSRIGIHQDLQYKGNAVLKEFGGCTHPEHIR